MRILVTGGRAYNEIGVVYATLDSLYRQREIDVIMHDGNTGVSALAESWAIDRDIPHKAFAADWSRWGVAAGKINNQLMLMDGQPDLVIAFPGDADSHDLIAKALYSGIRVMHAVVILAQ